MKEMGWNDEKDDQGKKSVELDLFSKNSVDGKSNQIFGIYRIIFLCANLQLTSSSKCNEVHAHKQSISN